MSIYQFRHIVELHQGTQSRYAVTTTDTWAINFMVDFGYRAYGNGISSGFVDYGTIEGQRTFLTNMSRDEIVDYLTEQDISVLVVA